MNIVQYIAYSTWLGQAIYFGSGGGRSARPPGHVPSVAATSLFGGHRPRPCGPPRGGGGPPLGPDLPSRRPAGGLLPGPADHVEGRKSA